MKFKPLALLCTVLLPLMLVAQDGFFIENNKKRDKVPFKLINNLVLIPVEVNGVAMTFLLDTGVSKPIIFNFLNVTDTLEIGKTERIHLRGLGSGQPVEALKSEGNVFKVGEAVNINQELFIVLDSDLSFTPKLGIPVHGIMGYDLFENFVVELNYGRKFIRLNEHATYKTKRCRKCSTAPLTFFNQKPYLYGKVTTKAVEIPVKLLIDTGGSDALWLFKNDSLGLNLKGRKHMADFLGYGLNGSVYGKRSKIEAFSLGAFTFKNANVAFPDSLAVFSKTLKGRNGSLAGNILKRFNWVFNYKESTVSFKKNKHFNEPFSYNKSGIVLEHSGIRVVKEREKVRPETAYGTSATDGSNKAISFTERVKLSVKPAFTVVELRDGSPAHKAGVQIEDMVVAINNKATHTMDLQDVTAFFYQEADKKIKLKVERNGQRLTFVFYLKDLLSK